MLTLIYQATLKQRKVPVDWKKALVVPIYFQEGCTYLSSQLQTNFPNFNPKGTPERTLDESLLALFN